MRPILPILIASAALAAEPPAPATDADSAKNEVPIPTLLPAGSVLTKVTIPRYDAGRRLTSSLHAAEMTVVDEHILEAKNIRIDLFNPDRSKKGRVDLKFARYDQQNGTIDSREPVEIINEGFHATGNGLSYSLGQSEGFLIGPVKTRFQAKSKQP
ncbi:MAG: LPS export ABC transporter periplasmic protein LptC [Luteolibacter sp.]